MTSSVNLIKLLVYCMFVCACTGNVKAQYQFPSFEPARADLANEQVSEFLSIDCQRLSESVRCVPLYRRLHIDDSVFDVTISESLVSS